MTEYYDVAQKSLVCSQQIFLPGLHIMLGSVKNFIKMLNKNREARLFFWKNKFRMLNEAEIREGVFDGPQIRQLMLDCDFKKSFALKLRNFQEMKVNMSLKIHMMHSHLDFSLENMGAVSDEHCERFHQDIAAIKEVQVNAHHRRACKMKFRLDKFQKVHKVRYVVDMQSEHED